jgi:uncharacterized protein (DUF433 family)
MLDWSKCPAVECSPKKCSGQWVFRGTRIPVTTLFENFKDGARVDDFLEWFPGVTREQVQEAIVFVQDYEWVTGQAVGRELI